MAEQSVYDQLRELGEENEDEFCVLCKLPRYADDIINDYNEMLCRCCHNFCEGVVNFADYNIYLNTPDEEHDSEPDHSLEFRMQEIAREMFKHAESAGEQVCWVCHLPRHKSDLITVQNVTVCDCCYNYGKGKVIFREGLMTPTLENTAECQLDDRYLDGKTIELYGVSFSDPFCLICQKPRLVHDIVIQYNECICHCCYQYSKTKFSLLDYGLTLRTTDRETVSSQSDLNKSLESRIYPIRSELLNKEKTVSYCIICEMSRLPQDFTRRHPRRLCHCCNNYANKIAWQLKKFPAMWLEDVSQKSPTSLYTSEVLNESSEIWDENEFPAIEGGSNQNELRNDEKSQVFNLSTKNSFKYAKHNRLLRSAEKERTNIKQVDNTLLPSRSLSINNDSNQAVSSKIVKFNTLAMGIENIYSEAFQLYKELQDTLKTRDVSLPDQNPTLILPRIPIEILYEDKQMSNVEQRKFALNTTLKSEKTNNDTSDNGGVKDLECNTSAARQNNKVIECTPVKKNYPIHSTPFGFNNGVSFMSPIIHQTLMESPFASPLTPSANIQSYFGSSQPFAIPQLRSQSKIGGSTSPREGRTFSSPVLQGFRTASENSKDTNRAGTVKYHLTQSTDTCNTSSARRNLFSGTHFPSAFPFTPSTSQTTSSQKEGTSNGSFASDTKEINEDSNVPSTAGSKTPKRKRLYNDSF